MTVVLALIIFTFAYGIVGLFAYSFIVYVLNRPAVNTRGSRFPATDGGAVAAFVLWPLLTPGILVVLLVRAAVRASHSSPLASFGAWLRRRP